MSSESAGSVLIVMPAYNREALIAEAIASVRSQTYPHWRLVIVDDASTDSTLQIAKKLAQNDTRIEVLEMNHCGCSAARNAALSRVNSQIEFIGFLDSDDVWYPDALTTLVQTLRSNQDCVGSHGVALIVDSNGNPHRSGSVQVWPPNRKGIKGFIPRDYSASSKTDFTMLVYGNFVPIGATLVRKWVFDKVGQFNPNIYACEDWEMWIRISSIGPFAYVNKELYKYRVHASNSPRPPDKLFLQEKEIFSGIYKSSYITNSQRTTLIRGYRAHQFHHCKDYFRSGLKKALRWKLARSAKEFRIALGRLTCALAFKPFN
jgi:glycosyltransferase involved in cell wall biosynthesis